MVDGFIEGHARNQRPHVDVNGEGEQLVKEDKKVIYEDVSLDRGFSCSERAVLLVLGRSVKMILCHWASSE
ncbi:hypothetical protein V6N12_060063 [Hibiscus sabdariffa]|uniref:Uncharacterized protein n=1 Tax=Hibiscus sabdariffa TaxID=183260 RepID=A0ABR2D3C5_9ROSI